MPARCECNANWVSPRRPIECTYLSPCLPLSSISFYLSCKELPWTGVKSLRRGIARFFAAWYRFCCCQSKVVGVYWATGLWHAHVTHTHRHTHTCEQWQKQLSLSVATTLRTFSLNKTLRCELTFYNSITKCHKLYAHTWMYMVLYMYIVIPSWYTNVVMFLCLAANWNSAFSFQKRFKIVKIPCQKAL